MMGIVVWAQEAVFIHIYLLMLMLGQVRSWVELPVQRRLYPIFMREVGSPDIHECFRGLTGSQRTPGIWGVTKIDEIKYPGGSEYLKSAVQNALAVRPSRIEPLYGATFTRCYRPPFGVQVWSPDILTSYVV